MLSTAPGVCYQPRMRWMLLASVLAAGAMDAPGPEALTQALAHEEAGDTAAALAAVDALVQANPQWALPRIEAARLLLKSGGSLQHAEAHLDAAEALAPDNPRIYYLRGLLSEEKAEPSRAMAAYERALKLRPSYEDARFRLAGLAAAQGDWLKTEYHARALSRAKPEWVQVRFLLAQALERQERLEDAEAELKALHEAQPANVLVTRRLVDFYERAGKQKLADKLRKTLGAPPKRKLRELKKSRR